MKYLTLLLTTLTLLIASPVYAVQGEQKPASEAAAASKGETALVSLNGMVCDFCARALEKVFSKQESVSEIDVNLDTKILTINFNEGLTLDDATITKLIKDSGYNVVEIQRNG